LNLRSTTASPDSSRKLLVAFAFDVIFAVGAYEFAEMVLAGDMRGFACVVLLAVASVFIIAMLNNWRNGAERRRFFRLNAWLALIITNLPAPAAGTPVRVH
jgi:hypothetical protein